MDTSHFGDVKEMDRQLTRAIFANFKYWDGRIEAHMKQTAPWTDRTTNARNGLFADARKFGKTTWGILLGHSVTYGIFLERGTRYMKARPIILPTIDEYAPRVIATLERILGRL